MANGKFHLTRIAGNQIRSIGRKTEAEHGTAQADKYLSELRAGLQYCADHYKEFPVRADQVGDSNLSLYLVNRHYIAFRVLENKEIAIAGLLHERMKIPDRLKELESMSRHQIASIEKGLSNAPAASIGASPSMAHKTR